MVARGRARTGDGEAPSPPRRRPRRDDDRRRGRGPSAPPRLPPGSRDAHRPNGARTQRGRSRRCHVAPARAAREPLTGATSPRIGRVGLLDVVVDRQRQARRAATRRAPPTTGATATSTATISSSVAPAARARSTATRHDPWRRRPTAARRAARAQLSSAPERRCTPPPGFRAHRAAHGRLVVQGEPAEELDHVHGAGAAFHGRAAATRRGRRGDLILGAAPWRCIVRTG